MTTYRYGRSDLTFKSDLLLMVIAGIAVGAALMFFLDPRGGARRRALVRDKAVRYTRRTKQQVRRKAQDMRNRAYGMVAEAKSALRNEPVDDDQLCGRVRSAIGRVVTHPHSIEVHSRNGVITLSGPILGYEVDELIDAVWHVRGVQNVIHQLDEHEESESIPGLQGHPRYERS